MSTSFQERNTRFGHWYSFKFPLILIGVLVCGVGAFVVRDLRRANEKVRQMHSGLVNGLDLIGELQYQTQEARRSMLYALTTTDSNLQVDYADQSRAADARVAQLIIYYEKLVSANDIKAGRRLERDWAAYLEIRNEVGAAILEGDVKNAVQLDLSEGVASFNQVRDDLQQIKQLYQEQARRQLAEVEASSNRSQFKLILILCLTQVVAIVAVRVIQRSRMLHAEQQLKMLEAVRLSEKRLREVIESINEGMFVLNRSGRVELWNSAAERNSERSREHVLGHALLEAVPEWAGTPLATALAALAEQGRSDADQGRVSIHFQHRDRVYDARIFPFDGGTTVFFDDITERKLDEEKLKLYAAKLEASNRELQDFAYVASHDLQEPLRKVQAFGDRLKSKYSGALPDEGRDYLARMQNAASRMSVLIHDLLTFSRVATKAQPFVPIDLATITREVLSDLEVRIEQTGGHVELGELPTIDADPVQMRQLMQNLIGNALKFHRADEVPIIKISSELIKSKGAHANGNGHKSGDELCQIKVEDNGIGFEEKYLERIFTVFQRLHGRTEYEGSGVGLAVCRKIVERHHGTITAHSAPDQGATFVITVPVQQSKLEVK